MTMIWLGHERHKFTEVTNMDTSRLYGSVGTAYYVYLDGKKVMVSKADYEKVKILIRKGEIKCSMEK